MPIAKSDTSLSRERILQSAEDVLRRFGPSKATVVDVARVLGVSHGSVYKHFASKAELRDAVVRVWLERLDFRLSDALLVEGTASFRLRLWLDELIGFKHERAIGDPELFAAYRELAFESREVVQEHVDSLTSQIETIIKEGISSGEFKVTNSILSAQAVLSATARFHNPAHAWEWSNPQINQQFEAVFSLVLSGLKAG